MYLPSDPVLDEKYWHKDIKMYVSNTRVTNFFPTNGMYISDNFINNLSFSRDIYHRSIYGPHVSKNASRSSKLRGDFERLKIISLQLEFLDRPQIKIEDRDHKLLYFETEITRISAFCHLAKMNKEITRTVRRENE